MGWIIHVKEMKKKIEIDINSEILEKLKLKRCS